MLAHLKIYYIEKLTMLNIPIIMNDVYLKNIQIECNNDYSETSNEIIIKILCQLLLDKKIEECICGIKDTIWTDGEYDSNQTDFEWKSNHLEIGVLAGSKREAVACLRLLRWIIDDDGTNDEIYDAMYKEDYTCSIQEIIDDLVINDNFVENHLDPGKITKTLFGIKKGKVVELPIETCSENMNLWSLDRLLSYYLKQYRGIVFP